MKGSDVNSVLVASGVRPDAASSEETDDGVPAEYSAAARRYMGVDEGDAWSGEVAARFPRMARIAITPEWVGVIDFETRFPCALA